ncbi:MAG: hypothetical protein FK734_03770 [Asgard group archaeon]|nr:hypothetical protein [Asgard group archaeon]
MVFIFLDIETFAENEFKLSNSKIIAIQYNDSVTKELIILKEWIDNEKIILEKFYRYLKEFIQKEEPITIIGYNLLRFDIPLLIHRIAYNQIESYEVLLDVFHSIFVIDLLQCLLPFNNVRFKGLNSANLAERFEISMPVYRGKDINEFYLKKQYSKIEEHIVADIDFTRELYWIIKDKEKMKRLINHSLI